MKVNIVSLYDLLNFISQETIKCNFVSPRKPLPRRSQDTENKFLFVKVCI